MVAACAGDEILPRGDSLRTVETASAGAGGYCVPQAPAVVYLLERFAEDACCARWARYDLPLILRMIAPSTIRSKNAIANGGSPRYSPQASKSMFVTNAVDRQVRALISLGSGSGTGTIDKMGSFGLWFGDATNSAGRSWWNGFSRLESRRGANAVVRESGRLPSIRAGFAGYS